MPRNPVISALFRVSGDTNFRHGLMGLCFSTFKLSISHRYCCGVISRASPLVLDHWYMPCSNLLYSRTNPFLLPVQRLYPVPASAVEKEQRFAKRIEIELRLDKTCQSIPRRRSVYPHAMAGSVRYCHTFRIHVQNLSIVPSVMQKYSKYIGKASSEERL